MKRKDWMYSKVFGSYQSYDDSIFYTDSISMAMYELVYDNMYKHKPTLVGNTWCINNPDYCALTYTNENEEYDTVTVKSKDKVLFEFSIYQDSDYFDLDILINLIKRHIVSPEPFRYQLYSYPFYSYVALVRMTMDCFDEVTVVYKDQIETVVKSELTKRVGRQYTTEYTKGNEFNELPHHTLWTLSDENFYETEADFMDYYNDVVQNQMKKRDGKVTAHCAYADDIHPDSLADKEVIFIGGCKYCL
ncbi:hypothetical protein KI655_18435 [Vibrio sp. D404a]|uniref:hypothetical protein n=1 Tax=unclassified Vibrio TaxID=2614977 RepID=UPI0025557DC4|nr:MULTISPECIES: hypothetical protein [unclassified Vibrio]MDK9739276.1 hypothetical protein [Vibrio sp. D404a]MDK9797688.1 hypothetical protein [Vibrio sp. D449a]